jgi:DNA-binding NarL/FixJ family response regulator
MEPTRTRCLLADDHPALAVAVRGVLEDAGYEIVGPASTGAEAVSLGVSEQPDVAIVDYHMPGLAGCDLVARLHEALGGTPVLVYTADAGDDAARRLLESGASGIVLKEAPLDDLIRALRAVEGGGTYIDPVLAAQTLRNDASQRPVLTARELDALRLLAEGCSHEAIAEQLTIGVETVRTHLRKASDKLGAATRTQAVASALRFGLIQ